MSIETALSELTRAPTALLWRGAESGLFDGLVEIVDGEHRYAPDATVLVTWSDRLGDDVVAGYITLDEANSRARQLRRRALLAS
jgi:hypothetical protein